MGQLHAMEYSTKKMLEKTVNLVDHMHWKCMMVTRGKVCSEEDFEIVVLKV
jgi:hypothetical protein